MSDREPISLSREMEEESFVVRPVVSHGNFGEFWYHVQITPEGWLTYAPMIVPTCTDSGQMLISERSIDPSSIWTMYFSGSPSPDGILSGMLETVPRCGEGTLSK